MVKGYGMKRYEMVVTLETSSGRIIRPLSLPARDRGEATARARAIAPKPGQTVVTVEVVR